MTKLKIAVVAGMLACAAICGAQVNSGDLTGTVQDATGATIAATSLEATNEATGMKSSTRSGAAGDYRINRLPPGLYTLTATAPGFAPSSLTGVEVTVSKIATVNLTLQVGQVSTSVEVTEAAANIDTTTSTISATFNERASRDLPTSSIGLGAVNLSLLNAGVASNGGLGVGRGPSVGGQRPRNNNFTIDGADNNSKNVTGAVITVPNDATQEFTLLQNQFSAEFGHSSGGQFNIILKGGTNSLHGSVYEYFQNKNLNAVDQLFANSGQRTNVRFDQNRYGGTIGGPAVKNKLFYFANWDRGALGQNSPPGQVLTPTAKGFATLSSLPGLSANNLATFAKYVPASGTPTAASSFPVVSGTPIEVGTLAIALPNYQNVQTYIASGDYNLSEKDQFRGRYIQNNAVTLDHRAALPVFFQLQPLRYQLATLTAIHVFTPNLASDLRLSYTRNSSSTPSGDYKFPGLDMFPNLTFSDMNLQVGPAPTGPQSTTVNNYQLADSMTWVKGRHTLQWGAEGRKYIAPNHFTMQRRGSYGYSTLDLFLHDMNPDQTAIRSLGDPTYYGDQWAFYSFVNDSWRVRPNLTVSLGVRYERTTVPFGEQQQSLNAISNVPGVFVFDAPKPQNRNFAPRVGLAWSPGRNGRTSFRAGFGIAYDVLYDNIGTTSPPPQFATTVDRLNAGIPNFLANGGIPQSARGPVLTAAQTRTATVTYIPDQLLPYSVQWNFGVQHVFAKDYTVDVRYLGTRGIHLPVQVRPTKLAPVNASNALPTYLTSPGQAVLDSLTTTLTQLRAIPSTLPQYTAAGFTNGALTVIEPIGNSSYNGLAVQVNKRYSRSFQLIGAYTWSHLIDDSTADFATAVLTPRRPQDFQNMRAERADSALDHRQRFTLGAVFDAPWFRKSGWLAKNVIGNWSVAPMFTYESPEKVTPLSQLDSNLNGDNVSDRVIINLAGTEGVGSKVTALNNSAGQTVAYLAVNPNAKYIQAGAGAYANSGRNILNGRPIDNLDLSLIKKFSFHEKRVIEFATQFFNAFNHAQFVPGLINRIDNPATNTGVAVTNYLTPGTSLFNNPEAIYTSNPRSIQLALKFIF